jgi:hypothetical protein
MAGYFQSPTITFGSTTLTNAGTENLFLAKYDTLGNLTWAKSVGCNMDDVGNGVALDASGSIYLTGDFNSPTIVFDTTTLTNVGDFNIFLAKFNSSGTVLWAKGAGGNMVDVSNTVAVDASGNPYIAGAFQGINIQFGSSIFVNTDPGNYDVFLAKYDNNGNVLCAARAAGTYDDVASSIAVDGSGNSYIVGYFYSPSLLFGSTTLTNADNVANNTSDGFLAKLSANTGINELSEISNISVFPNPANDIITIENTAFTKDETISIYDIQGQLLLQQTMLQAKTNIDISAFSKGIYFVKVKTANGMDVKKIVKE